MNSTFHIPSKIPFQHDVHSDTPSDDGQINEDMKVPDELHLALEEDTEEGEHTHVRYDVWRMRPSDPEMPFLSETLHTPIDQSDGDAGSYERRKLVEDKYNSTNVTRVSLSSYR